MREKFITPFIVLIALFIISIVNIINKVNIFESMIRLLIVFIIFYIIGKISEKIIIRAINKDKLNNTNIEIVEDVMVQMDEVEEEST